MLNSLFFTGESDDADKNLAQHRRELRKQLDPLELSDKA